MTDVLENPKRVRRLSQVPVINIKNITEKSESGLSRSPSKTSLENKLEFILSEEKEQQRVDSKISLQQMANFNMLSEKHLKSSQDYYKIQPTQKTRKR